MNHSYIDIQSVEKKFNQKTIFREVSLSLQKGELLSLVGPSGTGKSTLLRCIAGLEQFTDGEVRIEGKPVSAMSPKDRPIGMVFQQALLFPHLTILENVTYGLKLKKGRREAEKEGELYLRSVGLLDYRDAYPHSLSGGQQQRVALVRALILKPKLLLLDEPFSSLDPDLRRELRDWVRALLKDENMTAIFVTHDREEAMLLGDQVAILGEGTLQQAGQPDEVYQLPANAFVARFFTDALVLDEQHYVMNHEIRWCDQKSGEMIFIEAQWLNETYQYGQRYAHVLATELNRRLVIPVESDNLKRAGENGFLAIDPRHKRTF